MTHIGFTRSNFDRCVYFRVSLENSVVILFLYVYDILIESNLVEEVMRVKGELNQEFKMEDLGAATSILGIDIKKNRKQLTLCLSQ